MNTVMAPRDPRLPGDPFGARGGSSPQQPGGGGPRGARFDKLNKLFSGGGAPAPGGGRPGFPGAGAMESRMRMERLRGASTPAEVAEAADSLLAHHQLPDEAELLCKMTRHPDAGVGETALAELGRLHAAGRLSLTSLMKDDLAAFRPRCREPNALRLLESLLG